MDGKNISFFFIWSPKFRPLGENIALRGGSTRLKIAWVHQRQHHRAQESARERMLSLLLNEFFNLSDTFPTFLKITFNGKASTIKLKSRSDHDKTKVYQNPLDTCPGFFVGGPYWLRKYEFPGIPAAAFFSCFLALKISKNIITKVFHDFRCFLKCLTLKNKQKRRSEFTKIHIPEIKAHLQRSRDTCLIDFDKLSFYRGPIVI